MASEHSPTREYIGWLEERSMLHAARAIAARYSGQGGQWRHPYAETRPRAAATLASVWFTAYPAAIITRPGESVLATLGDEALWQAFAEIGIQGIHTGPMKRAGGVTGYDFTPTIDGHFDRIGLEIDPPVRHGRGVCRHEPPRCGHAAPWSSTTTSRRTRARARTSAWPSWPMPTIRASTTWWRSPRPIGPCCPACRTGATRSISPPEAVADLQAKGYIVGELSRVIFFEPGVKETNWSATAPVQRGGRRGAALGLPSLLQGGAAQPQLAGPLIRCAASGPGRRPPFALGPGCGHVAAGCQRLPGRGAARQAALPGPKGTRSPLPPTN